MLALPLPKGETALVETELALEPELELNVGKPNADVLNGGKPNADVLNGGKEKVLLAPKIELDAAAADDDDDVDDDDDHTAIVGIDDDMNKEFDPDTGDGNAKALDPYNAVRSLFDNGEAMAVDDGAGVTFAVGGVLIVLAGTAEFDDGT